MSKKKKPRALDLISNDKRVGNVCVSLAGRDAGLVLVIVGVKDDNFVYITDGKTRRISMPKLKKEKHLSIISTLSQDEIEQLKSGKANDALLRKCVARTIRERLN